MNGKKQGVSFSHYLSISGTSVLDVGHRFLISSLVFRIS